MDTLNVHCSFFLSFFFSFFSLSLLFFLSFFLSFSAIEWAGCSRPARLRTMADYVQLRSQLHSLGAGAGNKIISALSRAVSQDSLSSLIPFHKRTLTSAFS